MGECTGWTRRKLLKLAAGCAASSPASDLRLTKLDLFTGGEGGYALYRIPGIVVTRKKTLLTYCEARQTGRGDWGPIDILLRRGAVGGQTWSAPQKIANVEGPYRKNPVALAQNLAGADDVTYNNPVAIPDEQTGAVHFLFCLEYMRCFYMRSEDDGISFSKPVEITGVFENFRRHYDWKVLATGPGHGIQLRNGRLLVPVWLSTGAGGHAHRPSVVSTIYSDNAGRDWKAGGIAVPNTPDSVNPSETMAVQLQDGTVLMNARSESAHHRRLLLRSKDGASGWSPAEPHPELLEPICMASMIRLSGKDLIFSSPHHLSARRNLSIKLSRDEGKTWPVNKTLEPGPSAYSDLAAGADGAIYCFYERGSVEELPRKLTLATFSPAWLEDQAAG